MTRNVIVTGGGTGIGKAIAAAFIAQGDHVTIIGRRLDVLQAAAQEIGAAYQQGDVGQRADVERMVSAIVAEHPSLDVLVNNAGFVRAVNTHTPLDEAERLYNEVMDANVKGTLLFSLACAPHLRRPGGRIINMSSVASFTGGARVGSAVYAAAKAAINALTYGLARELSPDGITVNAIAPGLIVETEFGGGTSDEKIQWAISQTPAGRIGYPDEVAAAALYLASAGAGFVTGEVLNINGGWVMGH